MKNTISLCGLLLVSFSMLVACGDNDDQSLDENIDNDSEVSEETSSEGLVEKSDFESGNNEDDTEVNIGEGNTEDQIDLNLGDLGRIETSLSTYEVTLDGVEFLEELEGQESQMDTFIIADVTIKNTSSEPIDIYDALTIFEVSTDAVGGGYGLRSESYEGVEVFKGELEPSEKRSGQLLFENVSGEQHFLKVREGLIEVGGVKNKVTWSFDEECGE